MQAQKDQDSQGMRLLQGLQSLGKYVFTHQEAVTVAQVERIPQEQLNIILSNLTRRGLLLRLRRGLYAGIGSLPGQIQTHPFAIATRLAEPSAISHWSALQYHGLTEQVPQIITVSTPHKVYTPSMREAKHSTRHAREIQGVWYEYIHVKQEAFFGVELVWVDERFQIPITDKERTVLDLFVFSSLFGGMGEVLSMVEEAMWMLNIKKLVEYAVRYNKKYVAKRLGWTLEHFGVAAEDLKPLLDISVVGYCPLDPQKPKLGRCNKRWMIQENLIEQSDETITS